MQCTDYEAFTSEKEKNACISYLYYEARLLWRHYAGILCAYLFSNIYFFIAQKNCNKVSFITAFLYLFSLTLISARTSIPIILCAIINISNNLWGLCSKNIGSNIEPECTHLIIYLIFYVINLFINSFQPRFYIF